MADQPPPPPASAASPPEPSCQVRVGVRVRPLASGEAGSGGKAVVEACTTSRTVGIASRMFTYDAVFDSNVSQSDLYGTVSASLLGSFLDGYNATIMAYGQTGSGKTFTMGSEAHNEGSDVNNCSIGLIPRFMADIFAALEQEKAAEASSAASTEGGESGGGRQQLLDFQISASFLEVYGEDVHDLLDEDRKALPLREDGEGGVIVVGLKSRSVSNAAGALDVLHVGTLHRTTAATLMNHQSSRSHAVFTVYLHRTTRDGGVSSSRFTFVDLAGSERMKKTGAEGERAREGIKINEGLLALGNVINALADDERLAKGEKVHVPYRQSKLTRLLQDALGGNSQTLFLACVSPSDTNASETLSTLHYANRARNIKNAPTKNVDATVLELQRLHALTNVLQCELIKNRFANGASLSAGTSDNRTDDSGEVGQAKEELFKRKDVQEYMELIHRAAKEQLGSAPSAGAMFSSASKASQPNVTAHPSFSVHGALPVSFASQPPRPRAGSRDPPANRAFHLQPANNITASHNDQFDSALLDVNPDEDMAILDQLLDIQHHDQEYDKAQKEDQEELEKVEGELEEKESLLIKLKESLKVYHDMKGKYEVLMGEVQSLESEKASLAAELDRVQVDPTKGCSIAIKKKLEKVEMSLARARSETRKHQQMYRKAEQEAQKCRVLERKINDLKQGKVALMKKQREAAAKHRTFMDAKTREVHALKKKERKAGQQLSKLEAECQKHKANLERRKQYCDKITEKLKQTESHLMSLLAMRKRELHKRTKSLAPSISAQHHATKSRGGGGGGGRSEQGDAEAFAEETEEIKSIKFLLEKMVTDRVSFSQHKARYEERVAEYSELMRALTSELHALKDNRNSATLKGADVDEDLFDSIRENEHNVEDIELKLDLVGAELEDLRAKLPKGEVESGQSEESDAFGEPTALSRSENAASRMISNLGAPVVRTVLWDVLEFLTKSELERRTLEETLKRKESALQSFETEVDALTEKVDALSSELRRRSSVTTGNQIDVIGRMEKELAALKVNLERSTEEGEQVRTTVREVEEKLRLKETELAATRENLTVAEVALRRVGGAEEAEVTLAKLQGIWGEVGVSVDDREAARKQIDQCLEDTCTRKLQDAVQLREKTKLDIERLHDELVNMHEALGRTDIIAHADSSRLVGSTLMQHYEALQEMMHRIRPTYDSAIERRSKLAGEVAALMKAMHPLDDKLSSSIKTLMQCKRGREKRRRMTHTVADQSDIVTAKERRAQMFKNVEDMVKALEPLQDTRQESFDDVPSSVDGDMGGSSDAVDEIEPPRSLAESFLDECEKDVKQLKLMKSEIIVANGDSRNKAQALAKEMHLTARDVVSVTIQSIKKKMKDFPAWWDPEMADDVCHAVTSKEAIVYANEAFTKHLAIVYECLQSIASGRRAISQTLKGVVEGAYKTLLTAVEGEVYASEAYDSFHKALFRLPPLSKEHIHACIDEMDTLVTAVEAMNQSEIEALTVVWDAVNISSGHRGEFWGGVEDATALAQSQGDGPFDDIFDARSADVEDWVRASAINAKKVHHLLNIRLFKLGKIHEEVETQRSKQDAKSKIISLDSEVRILSAKLADFEEKASTKQRLLTKKMNSSTLLKEEKFRKQMQSKFTSKLEVLWKLLKEWEKSEGKSFDANLLSEDVKSLLTTSENFDSWLEKRTAFMHLRTTKQGGKRRAESPLTRDLALKHVRKSTSSSRARAALSPVRTKPSNSHRVALPPRRDGPGGATGREKRATRHKSDESSSASASSAKRAPTSRPKSDESSASASTAKKAHIGTAHKRHMSQSPTRTKTPVKFKKKPHTLGQSSKAGRPKEPLSPSATNAQSNPSNTSTPSKLGTGSTRLSVNTSAEPATVLPFGHVLSKTPTPKENKKTW